MAECNWGASTRPRARRCSAATWHALVRQQESAPTWRTLPRVVRDYCAAWRSKSERARWVRSLPVPGRHTTEPDGWPEALSWERHVPLWRDVYEYAGAFLRGEVPDPCTGEPTGFGSRADVQRSSSCVWEAAECGDTGGQKFGRWVCE